MAHIGACRPTVHIEAHLGLEDHVGAIAEARLTLVPRKLALEQLRLTLEHFNLEQRRSPRNSEINIGL
jgi:hypothetical protein